MWRNLLPYKEMDSLSVLNDAKEATVLNQELDEWDAIPFKGTYIHNTHTHTYIRAVQ